jgi:hypothetical protein
VEFRRMIEAHVVQIQMMYREFACRLVGLRAQHLNVRIVSAHLANHYGVFFCQVLICFLDQRRCAWLARWCVNLQSVQLYE